MQVLAWTGGDGGVQSWVKGALGHEGRWAQVVGGKARGQSTTG